MRIRSKGEWAFDILNVILICIISIVVLYPFLYVALASFSQPSRLAAHQGLLLWPLGFNTGAYELVFSNPILGISYLNTLFNVVVGTAYNMALTCMGAFVLSRRHFRPRKIVMRLIIFQMYFGGSLIPFFLLFRNLHLYDTRWAVIFSVGITSWNLIIMRTSFMAIPDSLEESARIDGAGEWTIFTKIVLPLSKPIIAVILMYYAVARWNEWFYPMILLNNRELYPLQLILREILMQNDLNAMATNVRALDREQVAMTVKYATIMVATVPILVLYPFLQKYFEKGIMVGSIKE